jgi:hypothetical protein
MAKYTAYDELDASDSRKPAKRKPRRASLLGLLGVLVGVAAIAVTQRDSIKPWADSKGIPHTEYLNVIGDYFVDPYHVAAAAAGLGILALLFRKMTGRTRGGWPTLALLLGITAAGIWRYQTTPKDPGTPERWVKDNVVDKVDRWIHPPADAPVTPQDQTVSTPATPSESVTPATQPATRPVQPPVKPVVPPEPPVDDKPNPVFRGL